jgi:integrase
VLASEALAHYAGLKTLRESTMRNHRAFLVHHLLPHFGAKPVTADTFSELEIERFIADRRAVLADSTLKVGLPTLKMILRHAVRCGLLLMNPLAGERLWFPKPSANVEPFTSSELRLILTAAYEISADFGAYVQTMAQTGIRPGEGLALRRRDLDLTTGTAHVAGTFIRGHRGPTKNARSMRTVSLLHPTAENRPHWHPKTATEGTCRVLEGLQAIMLARPDAENRLFPFTSQQVARLWTRTLKRAGVRYSKPHTLRHAFASILLSRGAPVLYLVNAGGWKDATTPLRVYAKWVPGDDPALGSTPPAQQADLGQSERDANSVALLPDRGPDWPPGALPHEVSISRRAHRPLHARGERDRGLLEECGVARTGGLHRRAAGRAVPGPVSLAAAVPRAPACVVWTPP